MFLEENETDFFHRTKVKHANNNEKRNRTKKLHKQPGKNDGFRYLSQENYDAITFVPRM